MWTSISGTGPKDVWLAGPSSQAVHWDGRWWTVARPDFPGEAPGVQEVLKRCWFTSIWAKSPGDATALLFLASGWGGTTYVMRFKDSAWKTEATLEKQTLVSLWGKDSVRFAAGSSPEKESRGGDWKPMARKQGAPCLPLSSMHGTGTSDVWALSRSGTCISHWDGSQWSTQPLP